MKWADSSWKLDTSMIIALLNQKRGWMVIYFKKPVWVQQAQKKVKTAFFRTLDLEIQNLKKEKKIQLICIFFGDFSCRNSGWWFFKVSGWCAKYFHLVINSLLRLRTLFLIINSNDRFPSSTSFRTSGFFFSFCERKPSIFTPHYNLYFMLLL